MQVSLHRHQSLELRVKKTLTLKDAIVAHRYVGET